MTTCPQVIVIPAYSLPAIPWICVVIVFEKWKRITTVVGRDCCQPVLWRSTRRYVDVIGLPGGGFSGCVAMAAGLRLVLAVASVHQSDWDSDSWQRQSVIYIERGVRVVVPDTGQQLFFGYRRRDRPTRPTSLFIHISCLHHLSSSAAATSSLYLTHAALSKRSLYTNSNAACIMIA